MEVSRPGPEISSKPALGNPFAGICRAPLLTCSRPLAVKITSSDLYCTLDHPPLSIDVLLESAEALQDLGDRLRFSIGVARHIVEGRCSGDNGELFPEIKSWAEILSPR